MSTPLESKVEENPKFLKRRQDKVRQLIDQEDESDEDADMESDIEEDETFELDEVNKHPCMQNILKVIDSMYEQFSQNWKEDEMPTWMKNLHSNYSSLNNSAKFFVLKLIINRSNIFEPYAKFWFTELADYVLSKDNGGKGLHYFLRDICTILITFSDHIDITTEQNKKY